MTMLPDESRDNAATESPSTANNTPVTDSHTSTLPVSAPLPSLADGAGEHAPALDDVPAGEPPLFARHEYVPPRPREPRKPNFGDLLLFLVIAYAGLRFSVLVVLAALHYHLFGVSTLKQAEEEIHYKLGSQAGWYLITLLLCVLVFPLIWSVEEWIRSQQGPTTKAASGFFAGIYWRGPAAAQHAWRLFGAAAACFVVAIADEILIPGPPNTPIDTTFHMPGAVWLLFAFGVTLAPVFEEITYRGFLLPALCTAYDWIMEQLTGMSAPTPDFDGGARWSPPAMVVGSVVTSIPFALMHGEQTGYSIGPFLLLVCISLVLCWIRLATRSIAAGVLVHSSYNLLLFGLMFLGTGGFRHLERM